MPAGRSWTLGPVALSFHSIRKTIRWAAVYCIMHADGPPTEVETPLALVRLTRPGWMEVHFKPGLTFTVEGVQQMMRARQLLGNAGRHRALMLLPDYVDFDLDMFTTDHHQVVPQPHTEAMAWVVLSERNKRFAEMYLAYFPPPFPSRVFLTEAEGRAWLEHLPADT